MSIKDLTLEQKEILILAWASERELLDPANIKSQALKTVEEVGELCSSINKHKDPIDDIGDIFVCIAILANQAGLTLNECVENAYNEIKDRTGKKVDGIYIRDE